MKRKNCGPARVAKVDGGSPAEAAGLRSGDRIVKIDGDLLRDMIDVYVALSDEGPHALEVERDGVPVVLEMDASGRAPGFEVEEAVFGTVATCDNNCVFCFVDQLPHGLRDSVYVKDDDFRLSFLCGNFITLTNITRPDLGRITRDRLSPLYVSLHSTEVPVRKAMFGNPEAGKSLKVLRGLLKSSIEVHIQIVLVRGVNDGAHLDRTLSDLSEQYGGVKSIGVVPVGLSSGGAKTLLEHYGYDGHSSAEVIEQLERWRPAFGEAGPFAADEFFFMAGMQPPDAGYYGDYEQLENGIGIARLFRDSFEAASGGPLPSGACEGAALVTTPIGAWALEPLGIAEAGARLVICENTLFGDKVNVCGLLPGKDAKRGLSRTAGISLALVPAKALDSEDHFIDGMSLVSLGEAAGVAVEAVECEGAALAQALKRICDEGRSS